MLKLQYFDSDNNKLINNNLKPETNEQRPSFFIKPISDKNLTKQMSPDQKTLIT